MTSTVKATCYMCDKPETSREHAPPRCIFPERKESLNGEDFRRDLIVVPSCDEHNCEKSRDDEYLMQVMPMSFGLNEVAAHHVDRKVKRSLDRKPKVAKAMMQGSHTVRLHDTETDTWHQGVALNIDLVRVHSVIEMNARAIYFHHRAKKLTAELNVKTNFTMSMVSTRLNDSIDQLFKQADLMLEGVERHGKNPKVFYYRMERVGDIELIEFTYYGTGRALISIFH